MSSPESPGEARPQYHISSVDSALRLLLMLRDRGELRLSTAAAELGVANSTAHRLLAMLAHHGFVRRDPATKRYMVGPTLSEVGLAAVRRMDVRSLARPLLFELSQQFDETVHCGVLEGASVRYVDAIESGKALRVASRTGMVLPAHCSSVGKALLARLDPARLAELIPSGTLAAATGHSVRSLAALERELERVHKVGYAVNLEESEYGVAAVGVAIEDDLGRPVAGVSCAAPMSRLGRRRVAEVGAAMVETVEAGDWRDARDHAAKPQTK